MGEKSVVCDILVGVIRRVNWMRICVQKWNWQYSICHMASSVISHLCFVSWIEARVKDSIFLSDRSSDRNQWTGDSFNPPMDLTIIFLAKLLMWDYSTVEQWEIYTCNTNCILLMKVHLHPKCARACAILCLTCRLCALVLKFHAFLCRAVQIKESRANLVSILNLHIRHDLHSKHQHHPQRRFPTVPIGTGTPSVTERVSGWSVENSKSVICHF